MWDRPHRLHTKTACEHRQAAVPCTGLKCPAALFLFDQACQGPGGRANSGEAEVQGPVKDCSSEEAPSVETELKGAFGADAKVDGGPYELHRTPDSRQPTTTALNSGLLKPPHCSRISGRTTESCGRVDRPGVGPQEPRCRSGSFSGHFYGALDRNSAPYARPISRV